MFKHSYDVFFILISDFLQLESLQTGEGMGEVLGFILYQGVKQRASGNKQWTQRKFNSTRWAPDPVINGVITLYLLGALTPFITMKPTHLVVELPYASG